MIEVRDAVKKFDGFAALDGANLLVPQGFVSRNFTVPIRSPAGNLLKGGNHYAAQRTEDCYHRRQPYP